MQNSSWFLPNWNEWHATKQQSLSSLELDLMRDTLGGIGHDLLNFLACISTSEELITKNTDPLSSTHRHATTINRALQGIIALTNQLMILAGRKDNGDSPIDLNELISEMELIFHAVMGDKIRLNIDLGSALMGVGIAKPLAIQILMNLGVNAYDAMPHGGELTIRTNNVTFAADDPSAPPYIQPGSYVVLSVTDTGIGMQPEVISHIFDRCFSTKSTSNTRGIGLYTVASIVKKCGGYIYVESELGKGSAFHIYLPHVAAAAADVKQLYMLLSSKEANTYSMTMLNYE